MRGYALSGKPDFLAPYNQGYAAEKVAAAQLHQLMPQLPAASAAELQATLTQAHDWRTRYASRRSSRSRPAGSRWSARTSSRARRSSTPCGSSSPPSRPPSLPPGQQALASLDDASDELHVALLAIAIGLVLVVAGLAVVLRNTAIRPVHVLAARGAAGRRR